jgi:hypothetical protein
MTRNPNAKNIRQLVLEAFDGPKWFRTARAINVPATISLQDLRVLVVELIRSSGIIDDPFFIPPKMGARFPRDVFKREKEQEITDAYIEMICAALEEPNGAKVRRKIRNNDFRTDDEREALSVTVEIEYMPTFETFQLSRKVKSRDHSWDNEAYDEPIPEECTDGYVYFDGEHDLFFGLPLVFKNPDAEHDQYFTMFEFGCYTAPTLEECERVLWNTYIAPEFGYEAIEENERKDGDE